MKCCECNPKAIDSTRASTLVVFVYFFPRLNTQNTLIMGPNNTKNSSKSVIFSYLTMNNIVKILFLLQKTPNLIKKLFLCLVTKSRVGPINSQHINFKWGNIFAGICTLVLSLCRSPLGCSHLCPKAALRSRRVTFGTIDATAMRDDHTVCISFLDGGATLSDLGTTL